MKDQPPEPTYLRGQSLGIPVSLLPDNYIWLGFIETWATNWMRAARVLNEVTTKLAITIRCQLICREHLIIA